MWREKLRLDDPQNDLTGEPNEAQIARPFSERLRSETGNQNGIAQKNFSAKKTRDAIFNFDIVAPLSVGRSIRLFATHDQS